jgi:cobalamin-dependent methionine synthase I
VGNRRRARHDEGDLFKAKYRGVRVSFGYPARPRLEDQAQLFRLLGVEEHIGVNLTEGFMMEPGGIGDGVGLPSSGREVFQPQSRDTERLERARDGERVGAAV